ncbi:MAG: hypothetical protein HQL58_09645 [Magnetococcales bacterium]|nr:hypothetical protein [Magnetococcales bacterium]
MKIDQQIVGVSAGGAAVAESVKPVLLPRPVTLEGRTYKIKDTTHDQNFYVTINDVIDGGKRKPFEIFINSKNMENFAWIVALTRVISAVFRQSTGDLSFLVDELKSVFDPRGGFWSQGHYVPSVVAEIGRSIEQHIVGSAPIPSNTEESEQKPTEKGSWFVPKPNVEALALLGDKLAAKIKWGRQCPKCSQPTLIKNDGCDVCTSCGYSKCG